MKTIIRTTLSDKITLFNILSLIKKGEGLHWYITELYGIYTQETLDHFNCENAVELEAKVKENPAGIYLSFKNLLDISLGLTEIYDVEVYGYKNLNESGQLNKGDLIDDFEYKIQFVDSDFWELVSRDKHFNDGIQQLGAD